MKIPTFLLVLLLAVISLNNCIAQIANQPLYNAQFRVISWDSPIVDLKYLPSKDSVASIDITPFSRSMFYQYNGPDPIDFGHTTTGADGKIVFDRLASVSLKQFKERTLLIFKSDSSNPGKYTISVVDDGDSTLPKGGFKFINLSNSNINITCATTKGIAFAGQALTLSATIPSDSDLIPVEMFAPVDGINKRIYSNRWGYGKTARTLVFIYYDSYAKSYLVKRIVEDVASIPTPTPSPRK